MALGTVFSGAIRVWHRNFPCHCFWHRFFPYRDFGTVFFSVPIGIRVTWRGVGFKGRRGQSAAEERPGVRTRPKRARALSLTWASSYASRARIPMSCAARAAKAPDWRTGRQAIYHMLKYLRNNITFVRRKVPSKVPSYVLLSSKILFGTRNASDEVTFTYEGTKVTL